MTIENIEVLYKRRCDAVDVVVCRYAGSGWLVSTNIAAFPVIKWIITLSKSQQTQAFISLNIHRIYN